MSVKRKKEILRLSVTFRKLIFLGGLGGELG